MTAGRKGAGRQATRRREAAAYGIARDLTRPPLPEPLPLPVPDSHCHLDIADGPAGHELPAGEALDLAASVGVSRVVDVGYDIASSRAAAAGAHEQAGLVAAVALHPNEAPKLAEQGALDNAIAEIEHLARSTPRVRAIGETGLDYYRTGPAGHEAQQESFRAHIALAKQHDLALVIHDRDAHADVLRVLDDAGAPDRVVMHCFSGDADFARACAKRGFYLSYAGTVTFKNAEPLREALQATPRERLLTETDAPFLAPVPHRGRPNSSYLIPLTVRAMARVRSEDLESMCAALDANTSAAFGGSWTPRA